NANEEKKEPSLAKVFRATRKRVLGRAYKEPIEDTQTKIARMEEITSQQAGEHVEGGESSNPVDPFEAVMGKDTKGRLRLYGRGVTASTLGKVSTRSSGASVYVPKELLKSIKEDVAAQLRSELRNELKTQDTQEVKDHWETEYCQTMAHQLKQLHPQLDINAEALRRLATATQSPGGASSDEHHRRGTFVDSSVGTNEVLLFMNELPTLFFLKQLEMTVGVYDYLPGGSLSALLHVARLWSFIAID
ncbi:hypothetical protein Dimus_000793, partial [Dionaea muscipula]